MRCRKAQFMCYLFVLFSMMIAEQTQASTHFAQPLQRAGSMYGGSSSSILTMARVLHAWLAAHGSQL